jgi:hypothetical protein
MASPVPAKKREPRELLRDPLFLTALALAYQEALEFTHSLFHNSGDLHLLFAVTVAIDINPRIRV